MTDTPPTKVSWIEFLWITRIFRSEFGVSDVRANYTRVYSWMANQLGHLTLGLGAALLFYWVVETARAAWVAGLGSFLMHGTLVGNAAALAFLFTLAAALSLARALRANEERLFRRLSSVRDRFDKQTIPERWQPFSAPIALPAVLLITPLVGAPANDTLLGVTTGVLTAAVLGLVVLALRTPAPSAEDAAELSKYHAPFLPGWRSALVIPALVPAGLCVLAALDGRGGAPDALCGIGLACSLFALAALALCKDRHIALIMVLIVLGAGSLATHAFGVQAFGLSEGSVATIAAVLFFLIVHQTIGQRGQVRNDARDRRAFYAASGLSLSVTFAAVSVTGLEEAWELPAAAAVASMALWLAKEFGSDMPKVHAELIAACRKRLDGDRDDTVDDGAKIEEAYLETGRWDARADTVFYLVGAWLAAGILSPGSLISEGEGSWPVGAEIIGLLLFMGIFIGGGRVWAHRQQGIDRTGAGLFAMLAVLDFRFTLRHFDSRRGLSAPLSEPRFCLWEFALGRAPSTFEHVLVFGPARRNDVLSDALVCEAALTDLPPKMFTSLDPQHSWRTARKISFDRLLSDDPTALMRYELPNNPVRDLSFAPDAQEPDAPPARWLAFEPRAANEPDERAASLVAITRVPPGTEALGEAIRKLSRKRQQHTAWFVALANPDEETVVRMARQLKTALARGGKSGALAVVTLHGITPTTCNPFFSTPA